MRPNRQGRQLGHLCIGPIVLERSKRSRYQSQSITAPRLVAMHEREWLIGQRVQSGGNKFRRSVLQLHFERLHLLRSLKIKGGGVPSLLSRSRRCCQGGSQLFTTLSNGFGARCQIGFGYTVKSPVLESSSAKFEPLWSPARIAPPARLVPARPNTVLPSTTVQTQAETLAWIPCPEMLLRRFLT